MKYPKINKQPHRTVNVPTLSGGLNVRDGVTGVRDNQLTDCVNVWYKDGTLKTRPSFIATKDMQIETNAPYVFDVKAHSDVHILGGVLMSVGKFKQNDDGKWQWMIDFWWQYTDKNDAAGSITVCEPFSFDNEEELREIKRACNYFVAEKDGTAYCYVTDEKTFCIKKLDYINGETQWKDINDDEKYVPTVYAHCQRTGWDDFKGTQFEGYNLINNSYKMIYSAYNEADSDKYHPMRFALGQKLPKAGTIKAEITIYDAETEETKTVQHELKYTETEYNKFTSGELVKEIFGEGGDSEDGLRLFVKYNYVGFCFTSPQDGIEGHVFTVAVLDTDEKVKKYGCNEDNVVITAPYEITNDELKKVFCMTRSTWFGGSANGINGGSRLFLCGNTEDKEKALVVWSGLNNPLYFGENNYTYVGDKSQAVTAFGQQGENLIILKEKSTYYSFYSENSQINADSLIGQSIVDYVANSVYFPMIQLNGSIGCDCPNTVKLCRNRLVWANSDGNIYTLYSNNQYSERTIYKVSEMVYPALKKENDLQNAVSCDFEGHYFLAVGNKLYVMDYNSYGYQYASSFTKNEDSNVQIPWWIWNIDDIKGNFYDLDNKLIFINSFDINKEITFGVSALILTGDNGEDKVFVENLKNGIINIENKKTRSMIQTKLFDFSTPNYVKNIDQVSVNFKNNYGDPIKVRFITNVGYENHLVTLNKLVTEDEMIFATVKSFYPCIKAIQNFGVKLECEGMLAIDGITFNYRLLGGVK